MYYWAGSVYACQATFFAWANDVLRYEEDSLRAVVIASMNMGSNAINAWWSIVFYGANFAPYFTRGMWAMIAVSIASKSKLAGSRNTIRADTSQWLYGLRCSFGSKFVPREGEKEKPFQRPLQLKSRISTKAITSTTPSKKSKDYRPR